MVAGVPGHTHAGCSGLVDRPRDERDAVHPIDIDEVVEQSLGEMVGCVEEPQPSRLGRQLLVPVGDLLAVAWPQRPNEEASTVAKRVYVRVLSVIGLLRSHGGYRSSTSSARVDRVDLVGVDRLHVRATNLERRGQLTVVDGEVAGENHEAANRLGT